MATLAAAQAAKGDLALKLRGRPWFRGIGITQRKCYGDPAPYEIQLNVDTAATADALRACPQTPREWIGVPVQIVVVGNVALGESITTQDYANVALGALMAVGTFMVGKIAVTSIIEARKERFDKKGQSPAAVKARESTFDGVMKLAATAFSIYQITQQFPELVTEAKKYLK